MQFRSNPFLYTIEVVILIWEKNLTLECNLRLIKIRLIYGAFL